MTPLEQVLLRLNRGYGGKYNEYEGIIVQAWDNANMMFRNKYGPFDVQTNEQFDVWLTFFKDSLFSVNVPLDCVNAVCDTAKSFYNAYMS